MYKLLFFLFIIPNILFAQKFKYTISGHFENSDGNSFAYLHIQKTDIREEQLIVVPIINNQFFLKGEIDKMGRSFISAIIFLGKNDKISIKDYNEMKMDVDFYVNEKILFVLEDSVNIEFKFPLKQSVVKGGSLNEENNLFQKALKDGSYLAFIKNNPDSSFSLLCLKAIERVAKITNSLEEIDIIALYKGLSDRIKQSFEGKEFAKKYLE